MASSCCHAIQPSAESADCGEADGFSGRTASSPSAASSVGAGCTDSARSKRNGSASRNSPLPLPVDGPNQSDEGAVGGVNQRLKVIR